MTRRSDLPRLTRRQWTALLGAAPVLAQVTSQKPPEGVPAPAPVSATPQEKLNKAYADIRTVSQRLSQIQVPMNVEPAFAFKV